MSNVKIAIFATTLSQLIHIASYE